MVAAALFTTAQIRRQPKGSSTGAPFRQNHSVLGDSTDGPGGHYAKCSEPVRGQTALEVSEIAIFTESESNMVVAMGDGGQGTRSQLCWLSESQRSAGQHGAYR